MPATPTVPASTVPDEPRQPVPPVSGGAARRILPRAAGLLVPIVLLLLVPLPIQIGPDRGNGQSAVAAWASLGRDLPEVGHGTLLAVAYAALLIAAVLGVLAGLWLAIAVAAPPPGDPSERVDADPA